MIRNWSGDWIQGFSHHIGKGEVLQAEVWGLVIGLKMAADLHIRRLVVECDSVIAIHPLNSTDYNPHHMATLLGNCVAIMKLFESCRVQHILRERNTVADILAKGRLSLPRGTVFFTCPPASASHAVFDDIAGTGRIRFKGLDRLTCYYYFFFIRKKSYKRKPLQRVS